MKRIQRQRTKGWRMPEGAVYVGRPTQWGNPYIVGEPWLLEPDVLYTAEDTTGLYATAAGRRVEDDPELAERWLAPLRGRDLACWCALDQPCHADVLLELANA